MVAVAHAHQAERRVNGIIELDSARGRQLGFTSDRFKHGSYLWDDDDRVIVSFVWSRAAGNFRALVAAIHAEGKTVAVPTPLPRMEAIVRKNGYTHAVEYDGIDVWSLRPRDRCSRCAGARGGVWGNENVLPDGTLVCDYCSADLLASAPGATHHREGSVSPAVEPSRPPGLR